MWTPYGLRFGVALGGRYRRGGSLHGGHDRRGNRRKRQPNLRNSIGNGRALVRLAFRNRQSARIRGLEFHRNALALLAILRFED